MSDDLRTALDTAARIAPLPRVAPDLWQQGRRRRQLRRLGQAAAVLVILAIVATLPRLSTPDYAPAELDRPARIGNHFLWQRTLWESPNGPATVSYMDHGTGLEDGGVGVIIGADGSYRRLDPGVISDSLGELSPDGRYLVQAYSSDEDKIINLETGDGMPLPAEDPVAWTADSRQLLVIDRATGDLKILDIASGSRRTLLLADDYWAFGGAAVSPDRGEIAILQYSQDAEKAQLLVMEAVTGRIVRTHPVGKNEGLAGPAAWTPDGTHVGLIADGQCGRDVSTVGLGPWRVRFINVQTGKSDDKLQLDGRNCPRNLAGWRNGKPAFTGYDAKLGRSALYTMEPGEKQEILLIAPEGARALSVARDFVERGTFRDTAANRWAASFTTYACVLIPPALVVLLILRARRRKR